MFGTAKEEMANVIEALLEEPHCAPQEPEVDVELSREPAIDGWRGIMAAASSHVVNFGVYGSFNSYSVFLYQMTADDSLGRPSIAQVALPQAVMNGLGPVASIITGRLVDHFGPRVMVIICSLAVVIGFVASSFATTVWLLLFTYTLPCTVACTVRAAGAASLVTWLDRRLSLGMGIATTGNGSGSAIVVLFASFLQASGVQWRNAFRLIALIPLCISVPVGALGIRFRRRKGDCLPRNAERERQMDIFFLKNLVRCRTFWTIFGVASCVSFPFYATIFFTVPYPMEWGSSDRSSPYRDFTKLSSLQAGSLLTVLGLNLSLGGIVFGAFATYLGAQEVVCALACGIIALAMCFWGLASSYVELVVVAIVLGQAMGGVFALVPSFGGRCFAGPRCGLAVGLSMMGYGVGGVFGVLAVPLMRNAFGSYLPGFCMLSCLATIAGAFSLIGLNGRLVLNDFAKCDFEGKV